MLITTWQCRDLMNRALQTQIRLNCGPDVEHVRRRFYRTRQGCWNRGILRYDGLRFYLDGGVLVIKSRPVNPAKQLRRKLQLLRRMGFEVPNRRIDVDGWLILNLDVATPGLLALWSGWSGISWGIG